MGPLKGYRIVEIAGIGPGPFACMMLADMGADVLRLERPTGPRGVDAVPGNVANRSRRSVGLDLKNPDAVELVLRLVEGADALIEGFRPGVAERLGIGPDACLARNPRLVYGRMTGWGQDGPYATMAGHDINYIALAGALAHFGRPGEPPVPPINMVGDFGGGGMLMAFGVVCGLLEAKTSGQGQVVDAAMVDGSATLMAMIHGMRAMGMWNLEKGTNVIDGGAGIDTLYLNATNLTQSLTFDPNTGNGALADGTNLFTGIELLAYLQTGSGDDQVTFGNPTALGQQTWNAGSGNDTAIIELEFTNGAIGIVHTTRWATGHKNHLRLEAHGTDGALMFDLDRGYGCLVYDVWLISLDVPPAAGT